MTAVQYRPRQETLDLIEDVEFLLSWGEDPARIADRVGKSPSYIAQVLRRYGNVEHSTLFNNAHNRKRRAFVRAVGTRTVKGVRHGTRSNYRDGCRCDECRAANSEYQRAYWRRRHGGEVAA